MYYEHKNHLPRNRGFEVERVALHAQIQTCKPVNTSFYVIEVIRMRSMIIAGCYINESVNKNQSKNFD